MNRPPGVNIMLFSRRFAVVRLVHLVVLTDVLKSVAANCNLVPIYLSFCAAYCSYNTTVDDFLPFWNSRGGNKNILFVPLGIYWPTHYARHPRSLANAIVQTVLSGPQESSRYFIGIPLSGLTTKLRRESASWVCWMRCMLTMWTAAAKNCWVRLEWKPNECTLGLRWYLLSGARVGIFRWPMFFYNG